MPLFLIGVVVGALAGFVLSRLLRGSRLSPAPRSGDAPTTGSGADIGSAAEPLPAPPPAPPPPPPVPADDIAVILPPLAKTLLPLADELGHPRGLPGMQEFQAVVSVLRRPDVSLTLLREHALGADWPLACAAFTALAQHPERQSLSEAVMRHLDRKSVV